MSTGEKQNILPGVWNTPQEHLILPLVPPGQDGGSLERGSSTLKVAPQPGSLSTFTVPP